MAWISVHEQVIGGKLRNLAKEIGCSQNEALGVLIRLWLWAISNAGKDGFIVGADKEDVAEILNIGIDKRYSSVDVVDALITTNWIDADNGLYIHDWEEWQEQWYKAISIREKDAARKREERKRKRMASQMADQSITPEGSQLSENMEQDLSASHINISYEKEPKQKPVKYSKNFEEFWRLYPRKIGKAEAYKKYMARLNDGWSENELSEAAKNYASKVANERTEEKYIKHGKTFLGESTPFLDYLPKNASQADIKVVDEDDPYGEWR